MDNVFVAVLKTTDPDGYSHIERLLGFFTDEELVKKFCEVESESITYGWVEYAPVRDLNDRGFNLINGLMPFQVTRHRKTGAYSAQLTSCLLVTGKKRPGVVGVECDIAYDIWAPSVDDAIAIVKRAEEERNNV